MNMKMRHAFTGIRSAVDHNSIAGFLDPEFFCELTGNQQQFSENGALSFRVGNPDMTTTITAPGQSESDSTNWRISASV